MSDNTENSNQEKKPQEKDGRDPNNTNFDERDIDHFMTELQRIIHDPALGNGPPGFQARFARTISQLNAQKVDIREKKHPHMEQQVTKKELLKQLDDLTRELEEAEEISGRKRFQILKNIANIRESIVSKK